MIQTPRTKGYSLIEVMVAITILMLSIIGPITIAAKSYQSAQYARQQTTAFFLAQEGITAVNMLRNDGGLRAYNSPGLVDAWNWVNSASLEPCFEETGCDMDFRDYTLLSNVVDCATIADCQLLYNSSASRAVYQHFAGEPSPYTRVIKLEFLNPEEVLVESTVTWDSHLLGATQEVRLHTSLFNLYK